MIMAEAFSKLKDYTSGLSVIARWIVRNPTVMESQICSYDIYDERRYIDWAYQWIRFKNDSKDEEAMVDLLYIHKTCLYDGNRYRDHKRF